MKRICSFCGNAKIQKATVEYIYRRDGRYLIVSGVPCEECTYCGERYYQAKVLRQIEDNFDLIEKGKKRPRKAITVPVEEFAPR